MAVHAARVRPYANTNEPTGQFQPSTTRDATIGTSNIASAQSATRCIVFDIGFLPGTALNGIAYERFQKRSLIARQPLHSP